MESHFGLVRLKKVETSNFQYQERRMSPGEMRVLLLILGSLKSSVAHPKEQRAEDGPVESPYQELGLGERDLYSDLNLRYK
ncbi:uncharacterized protein LOC144612165 isoform X2 [Rhinoraja longicauda]